ncbi:MAG TPA: TonB family protein [Candidatus Sulfotelmatobacter sp.]
MFLTNLRDVLWPRQLPPLRLNSAPAPFWRDVFVTGGLPWRHFLQSAGYHVAVLALCGWLAHSIGIQPQPLTASTFTRDQVVSYRPSEYLPSLNTLPRDHGKSRKADPAESPQTIISIPTEADNLHQTLVAAPQVKIKHDVPLPNIVALREEPILPIEPAPLVPAAGVLRIQPDFQPDLGNSVVAPPPDMRRMTRRLEPQELETSIVAPPPDLQALSSQALKTPRSAVIEPPPDVKSVAARMGDLNIAPSSVVAPAPQLSLADQRSSRRYSARAGPKAGSSQVVPPPPSLKSSGGATLGSANRGADFVSLSVHPSVSIPAEIASGNRRGSFAASPDGKSSATGAPGSSSGNGKAKADERGAGAGARSNSGKTALPSGLYVGEAAKTPTSAVAGDASAANKTSNSRNPNLLAGALLPRVTPSSADALPTGDAGKLSEAERRVFGERKFYSLTLNMPNLNSGGGSWVIRFAEMQKDIQSNWTDQTPAPLSAPAALRKVDPGYPIQLMRENVAGTEILYAVIHSDGSVGDVRVLRSVDDRVDQFATRAVAQWHFDPATRNGMPVEVEATFQIPFHPARGF